MSSTRHANEDRQSLAYERYMSAPLYTARRPVPTNVVAEKAMGYASAADRRLLFFVQALSMQRGGLRAAAADLAGRFPEADGLAEELFPRSAADDFAAYLQGAEPAGDTEPGARAGSVPSHMTPLHEFLVEFCINPALDLDDLRCRGRGPKAGLLGVLEEYRLCLIEEEKTRGVTTSVGKLVYAQLDEALALGRITVIEAPSGWGKSCGAESWCRRHLGEAYFITLSGITSRTILFQRIATALGMATCQRKASELQAKIEAFVSRTSALLVIDEAHFLWPQSKRISSNPELIDWVDTLVNMGARVALICTDQFSTQKGRVESQTAWTADQFRHRVRRHHKIESQPTSDDLRLIALHLLRFGFDRETEAWTKPLSLEPNATAIKMIVGWSLGSALPLRTVTTIIEAARFLAYDRNGRDIVGLSDVTNALEAQESSDLALNSAGRAVRARQRNAHTPVAAKRAGIATERSAGIATERSAPLDLSARGEIQQMSRLSGRGSGPLPANRSSASPLSTS